MKKDCDCRTLPPALAEGSTNCSCIEALVKISGFAWAKCNRHHLSLNFGYSFVAGFEVVPLSSASSWTPMQHKHPASYAAQSVQKSSSSLACLLIACLAQAAPRQPQHVVARHPTIGEGLEFGTNLSEQYCTMPRPSDPQQQIKRHGPISLWHSQKPLFHVAAMLIIDLSLGRH